MNISDSDFIKIRQLLESHSLLSELKSMGVTIFDDVEVVTFLPCNCLAQSDEDERMHSSDCACYYEDSPYGIENYERLTAQMYVR